MAGERKIRGLTPNQMAFANSYVTSFMTGEGTTSRWGHDAALEAGYMGEPNSLTLYSKSSTLLRNPAIKAEIELRIESARKAAGLTAEYLIAQALEIYQLAKDDEKWSASISALSWAARIGGFVVDKIESKNWNIHGNVDDLVSGLSMDELKALAADRIKERLALKEGNQDV